MRFRFSDAAASSVIGFLFAGIIFIGSVGTILYTSQTAGRDNQAAYAAEEDVTAGELLDLFLESPGYGWAGGAENVTRFGLLNDNGTGINVPHLRASTAGQRAANAANGYVDTDEILTSVGLDPEQWGLRLRYTPNGLDPEKIEQAIGTINTAIVVNWGSLVNITVPLGLPSDMVSEARAELDTQILQSGASDRQILGDLGLSFDDRVYISASAPTILVDQPTPLPDVPLPSLIANITLLDGDVYPDNKAYLRDVLPGRLADYDALIIGSEVDHGALTHGTTKAAIQDWVAAGGTLVVFGSSDSDHAWLNPTFSAVKIEASASGPLSAVSSSTFPTSPYALDWQSYPYNGTGWNITSGFPELNKFEPGLRLNDDFAVIVTEEGEAGNGSMGLSSIALSAVRASHGQEEAEAYATNYLVAVGLLQIPPVSITWGDSLPTGVQVSSAGRTAQAWYPGYGHTTVNVQLMLWRDYR